MNTGSQRFLFVSSARVFMAGAVYLSLTAISSLHSNSRPIASYWTQLRFLICQQYIVYTIHLQEISPRINF